MNISRKQIQEALGISDDFAQASDHPYNCRCDKCLDWWYNMGPDDDQGYGPFSAEEIDAHGARLQDAASNS